MTAPTPTPLGPEQTGIGHELENIPSLRQVWFPSSAETSLPGGQAFVLPLVWVLPTTSNIV